MATCQISYIRRVANENTPTNRVAELRNAKGLTQEELADLAGMHQTTLSKIERGRRGLDQEHMRRLAPHLGVTPAELLPVEENPYLLSAEERSLIERLRASNPQERATFDRVAQAVLPYEPGPVASDTRAA